MRHRSIYKRNMDSSDIVSSAMLVLTSEASTGLLPV